MTYIIKVRDREAPDTSAYISLHTLNLFLNTADKWKTLFFQSEDRAGAEAYIEKALRRKKPFPHYRDYRIYAKEGRRQVQIYEYIDEIGR